ncbi:MAG TPA: class II aldolase/adducin family protein [Pilimelia sp.]|nr:class II aldolase/adducin family protein [Pilimelia sp.]
MNYVPGDLREQLAHVGYDVVHAGLVVGSGGNLSARAPGDDVCWVTASGTWLDRLDRPSFVRVRVADGTAVDSGAPPPSTEVALHVATYRARPDANAVVHLHPQTVLLLDALGERVRLATTDHAFYLREIAVAPFRPPGSAELADVAAAAVAGGVNAVVLSGHGCSVVGDRVEVAHKRARNLEEAAQLTYRALALGRLTTLPEVPATALTQA